MRVLVISNIFPPSSHSNAKRPGFLVNGMLAAGWEVEVMTSDFGVPPGQVETDVHPQCRIVRVPNVIGAVSAVFGRGGRVDGAIYALASGLLYPDYWMPWARAVFRKCRRSIERFDRIVAFVHPPSVLLSGSYRGLVDWRWVFDFQESVTPQYKIQPRTSPVQRWFAPRLERLERRTLHQAGRVVFTAESNCRAYLDAGLVEKNIARHVPYFYESSEIDETVPSSEMFEIGYFGNFDLGGERSPEAFLKSLGGFLARYPQARGRTRFVFYGTWRSMHDKHVHDNGLSDVVQINRGVSYQEYLRKIRECSILLLVVAAAHNLFMPSKIVDYFGARRPILAFVPRESEMHDVLLTAGMEKFVCGENSVEDGIRALEALWIAFLNNSLTVNAELTTRWSLESQLPRYLDILTEMTPDR
jgi:hypothetical protein